jgi:hypothetical protein
MKELVKPIKKENQFKSVELYNECPDGNYCGGANYKDNCIGGNYCGTINNNSSEEDDILF